MAELQQSGSQKTNEIKMLSAKLQEFSAQNDALRKTTVELQVNNIYDSWNANFYISLSFSAAKRTNFESFG